MRVRQGKKFIETETMKWMKGLVEYIRIAMRDGILNDARIPRPT